jgi:hypothetical protein
MTTSILTTKSKYRSLSAQRLSELTVDEGIGIRKTCRLNIVSRLIQGSLNINSIV